MTDAARNSAAIVQDIYHEHIIPTIKSCEKDDELLFVTPSTFFGFYSIGAKAYEEVCSSLRDAKERGVQCRILIDVEDVLTARAAEGLLMFLDEGKELRDMKEPNRAEYYLMRHCHAGDSYYVEFDSKTELPLDFLRVRVRPFRGLLTPPETLNSERAWTRYTQFQRDWIEASSRVTESIKRHTPLFHLRRRFDVVQLAAFLGFFTSGSMFGVTVTISIYEEFELTWWVVLAYVAGALLLGAIGSAAGALITQRLFGRQ